MKILFVITGLGIGGAERQVLDLADQMSTRGHKILIAYLTGPARLLPNNPDIKVVPIDISKNPIGFARGYLRLRRLIRDFQPDVVHSHMVHANILARLARPIAHVPMLICTAHNIDEGGHLRELLYRLSDPLCDLTTQVSQAGLERYVRVGATPQQHKIRHIPNGIDTDFFHPNSEACERLHEDMNTRDAFVWLAVGRFDSQKDYPNMLMAYSDLIRERPEALLFIVGDGPLRPAMEDLSQKLGIMEKVRFLGSGRDVPGLMNVADGYVMSSAWEGMPMVLLEASATGLPIVATDVGGNNEVVKNGETGFLVPPKDPKTLARAMLQLMDLSEEERRRMGEAGRSYIEAKYSMDRVAEMWERLYRNF